MIPELADIVAQGASAADRLGPHFRTTAEHPERVARWVAAATGGRPEQLPLVLRAVGWSEADLSRSLADVATVSLPDWGQALADFLQALPDDPPESPGAAEADEWRPDPRVDPLTSIWNHSLVAGLELLPDSPVPLAHAARTDLAVSLVGRLLAAITRALEPELVAARSLGIPPDQALPGDRAAWLDRLEEMPGLAHPMGVTIRNWRRVTEQMLSRLAADLPAITEAMCRAVPTMVTRFAPDAGDPHEGGQSVCLIRFDTGDRVVYKPKPQDGPAAWQDLLGVLAEHGIEVGRRQILVRDGYGWDEVLQPDEESGDARRWLRSYGALLRALELVEAADMWFDNLLTTDGLPQFIDIETVFQPRPHGTTTAQQLLRETIAPTGAVSMPVPLPDGGAEEIGGLRQPAQVRLPFTEKVLGSLSSRVEGYNDAGMMVWTPPRWRPDFPADLDVVAELLPGYRAVDRVPREPLHAALRRLAAAPSRVVLRSTFVCYLLLRDSLRPEVLGSGWERDIALAGFFTPAVTAAQEGRAAYAEQLALLAASDRLVTRDLDVPLVRHDPTSDSLTLDDGTTHPGWFDGAPVDRALRRGSELAAMREDVLAAQTRTALGSDDTAAVVDALVGAGADPREASAAVAGLRA